MRIKLKSGKFTKNMVNFGHKQVELVTLTVGYNKVFKKPSYFLFILPQEKNENIRVFVHTTNDKLSQNVSRVI